MTFNESKDYFFKEYTSEYLKQNPINLEKLKEYEALMEHVLGIINFNGASSSDIPAKLFEPEKFIPEFEFDRREKSQLDLLELSNSISTKVNRKMINPNEADSQFIESYVDFVLYNYFLERCQSEDLEEVIPKLDILIDKQLYDMKKNASHFYSDILFVKQCTKCKTIDSVSVASKVKLKGGFSPKDHHMSIIHNGSFSLDKTANNVWAIMFANIQSNRQSIIDIDKVEKCLESFEMSHSTAQQCKLLTDFFEVRCGSTPKIYTK